ncbi:hypothetical protein COW81_03200 [Candidatus Campbellbacteria bacterium CG22_combo_CG10-13_8_21_14_all_36_13]|uniref:Glycosyl transferase family 1 n=1 Tax=Candidatus Campbellbacteria bacterium CG22_combo_CG10-13_8_21_14_all_36_13 TaxID=1974529 RepID=A0A2H0DZ86_9BACT|nr:MAG: hypothetical protein COW81_03200 [Candidatus Campbellbacteria bacterium CG22_combo_CG10-13_8_21_14_all_36_13]
MEKNQTRKKILFLITKSNFGGAQRYVFDLATSLPKDAYESTVVLGGEGPLKEKLDVKGIRTMTIDNLQRDISIKKEFSVFLTLIKLFKQERPDIIHLNSSKIGGVGALAGRIAKVPKIVFTGHGWAFNENRSRLSKILIFLLHSLTIILSHHTISVSEETKKQITSKFGFLNKKMIVIYNGIEKEDFIEKSVARSELMKLANNLNINTTSYWIGTVGELHHIKGHHYLIEAIAELKEEKKIEDIQLLILGSGEEKRSLEKDIKNFRLTKNVFLLGQVKDAQKYMKAFDLFVFPSLSEAFPYTILEAGSAGLPIIASRVGGIKEIIKDKESGLLINPKDIFALKNSIISLKKDIILSQRYGIEIQKTIQSNMSKNLMIEKTIGVYNL